MKKALVFWWFLIICYELVSVSYCESASNPETREARLLEHENELLPEGDSLGEVKKEIDLPSLSNVKRPKGSYGGGDLLRPRDRSHSAASSNLCKASVVSMVIKHAVAGLLAITFFY